MNNDFAKTLKAYSSSNKSIQKKVKDYMDKTYSDDWIINQLIKLRELNQECEGTFEIKDGNVTDINITGIALMPRFRDKDGDKE